MWSSEYRKRKQFCNIILSYTSRNFHPVTQFQRHAANKQPWKIATSRKRGEKLKVPNTFSFNSLSKPQPNKDIPNESTQCYASMANGKKIAPLLIGLQSIVGDLQQEEFVKVLLKPSASSIYEFVVYDCYRVKQRCGLKFNPKRSIRSGWLAGINEYVVQIIISD